MQAIHWAPHEFKPSTLVLAGSLVIGYQSGDMEEHIEIWGDTPVKSTRHVS